MSNYPNNYNYPQNTQNVTQPVTGSEKTKIKSTAGEYTFQQKSNFTDSTTGRTEKFNIKAHEDRERSRSNSSERRRRNMGTGNIQQTYIPPTTSYMQPPMTGQMQPPMTGQMQQPYLPPTGSNLGGFNSNQLPGSIPMNNLPNYQPPMMQQPMPSQFNQPMSGQFNQPMPGQFSQPMPSSQYSQPIYTNQPVYSNTTSNQGYVPSDLYAREKGKVVERGNKTKTTENLAYVDPITGLEQEARVKTTIIDRSRSKSKGKSKTTYDHKVKDTTDGPEVIIKEKHKEGGVMANIKNKLHNMVNH